MSVVRIRVAPEDVDVNLEPNKQTVILRFAKDVEVAFDNVVSEHFGKGRVGGEQESADAASAPAAEASAALQGTARSPAATADPANSMSISTFNFEIDETCFESSKENSFRDNTLSEMTGTRFKQVSLFGGSTENRRPEFRNTDTPKPKRPRVDDSNQPKLEFFWKEGSELKSSVEEQPHQPASVRYVTCDEFDSPLQATISLLDLPDAGLEPAEARIVWAQDPGLSKAISGGPDSSGFSPDLIVEDSTTSRFGGGRRTVFTTLEDLEPVENGTAAKSWARGNYLAGLQGEVVCPVNIGRTVVASPPQNPYRQMDSMLQQIDPASAVAMKAADREPIMPSYGQEITARSWPGNEISALPTAPSRADSRSTATDTGIGDAMVAPPDGAKNRSVEGLQKSWATSLPGTVRSPVVSRNRESSESKRDEAETETTNSGQSVTNNGDFEASDFQLVKRGRHQLQISPPREGKKVRFSSGDQAPRNESVPDGAGNLVPGSPVLESNPQNVSTGNETGNSTPDPKPHPTKKHPSKPKVVHPSTDLEFDVNKLLRPSARSELTEMRKPATRLIGQLQPSGYWMFLNGADETVHFLNHHRIIEVTFFQRLMKVHALPSAPTLRGPIDLFADPGWIPDLTPILLELAGDPALKTVELTDPRFTLNGITIQVRTKS